MSLKRNVAANYVGAAWNAVMTFAFVPLYIHYLGIEAYGLIGVYAILQAWLSLLDLGLSPALSREMAGLDPGARDARHARDLVRSIEWVAIGLAGLVALIVWSASGWMAAEWLSRKSLPQGAVAQAVAIMGGVIGLRLVENIYRAVVVGQQRQVALNMVMVFTATVRGAGAVLVLAFVSPTIQAYFFWQLAAAALSTVLLGVLASRGLPTSTGKARFSFDALRGIWRFALGTFAITFLSLILMQVDKVLLSRMLSLEAFGYYAFAAVVAQLPLALVGPVTQAYFPRFSDLHKRGDIAGLAATYHAACQLATVLLGSATVFLIAFGERFLGVWTGNAVLVSQTSHLVTVLAIGGLLNGLVTVPYFLQLSSAWTGLTARVNLVAVTIVLPLLWWLVPRYGAIGAAWVWVGLNAGCLIAIIPSMHRRLLPGAQGRWLRIDVGLPLIAAVVAGIALRVCVPPFRSASATVVGLAGCAAVIVIAATFAAPILRAQVRAHLFPGRGSVSNR